VEIPTDHPDEPQPAHKVKRLTADERRALRRSGLTEEQIEFIREKGYLKGVRILTDDQVEVLRAELEQLMDPAHPGRHLFHEYHSNESTDPSRVVFHALGAWRVMPGFHDLLWNCLLYTSPSPRDLSTSRMPSSA